MRAGRAPALEVLMTCELPNRDGERCGQSGVLGLPSGICARHAVEVFRAVVRLGGEIERVPLDDI